MWPFRKRPRVIRVTNSDDLLAVLEDPTIPDAVKQVVEAVAEPSGITLGPTDDDMAWLDSQA